MGTYAKLLRRLEKLNKAFPVRFMLSVGVTGRVSYVCVYQSRKEHANIVAGFDVENKGRMRSFPELRKAVLAHFADNAPRLAELAREKMR